MININKEDFGTLCICALRYCHGRRSYMPSLVQEIVQNHFGDLSEKDLRVIADDERFQREMNLWGDRCDREDWDKFYYSLNEFRQAEKEEYMKFEELKYLGDDITFCTADCETPCRRKPEHIRLKDRPHSYSDFSEVCVEYKPKKGEK